MAAHGNETGARTRSPRAARWTGLSLKVIGVCATLALAATTASVEAGAATSPPSPGAVAQSYIAALGPASAKLIKIEAELKALPITATSAQVNALVAQVQAALKPVEALGTTSTAPVSHGPNISLLSLPAPVTSQIVGGQASPLKCDVVSDTPTASVEINGIPYVHGIALSWGGGCELIVGQDNTYTWKVGTAAGFQVTTGFDQASATSSVVVLSFSSQGRQLPFLANGTSVTSINLKGTEPVSIKLSLTGVTSLTLNLKPLGNINYKIDLVNGIVIP
jgi:hypothetical protein